MKNYFNETKVSIQYAMYRYIEESFDKKQSLNVKSCVKFVESETGYSEDAILKFLIIDYSILAHKKVNAVSDEEIREIEKAIKNKKKE